MATIKSINEKRATIEFSDFCIRLFVKYQGPYCSEIRVWKLPPSGSFLSMFNIKNLVWAVYDDKARMVHGWFTPLPVISPNDKRYWLKVFADSIADCKNFDEIKEFLIDVEGMLSGDTKAMSKLAYKKSKPTRSESSIMIGTHIIKQTSNSQGLQKIETIIHEYGKVLERVGQETLQKYPAVIYPQSLLPYSKEVIESALNDGLRYINDEKMRESIKFCLGSLVAFIDDEEANKRNNELLNSKGFKQAIKRRLNKEDKS